MIGGVTKLISGNINSIFTTAPVQDSDTGGGYFVVISNSTDSVVSDVAVLAVAHEALTNGYLEADEYVADYANNHVAMDALTPTASLPTPNKIE